ncbi:MAG: MBL fold metallo-hydrolase [Ruminococcaceae bacterium]|nr:MBL fold metallo-hydrolase [Oscillospiraceae bacterium]
MKLTFCGAAHEVTGSCYLIEACGKNILVDYGLEQGFNVYESGEIPVPATEIDYVFLTHAHIDHSGRLPLLSAQGFKGTIFSTKATYRLCNIMLQDSAHIQEFEAEWKNRKSKRAGKEPILPLYTMDDAIAVLKCFEYHNYNEIIEIADGIQIRFIDAGHLLGSSSIEVFLTENGISKKLVFSGDIGNNDQPLVNNPTYITEADYVIMESTYGDRAHGSRKDYVDSLAKVIQRTFDRGGTLVIPSFAVGRTQEVLYFLRQIKEQGLVKEHGDFKVYVDSPLAVEATNIYSSCELQFLDKEARELISEGKNPIAVSNLHLSVSSDESKAINFDMDPKIIISASGMCDAGRIKHHLKYNLWRPESTILFVGYQSVGTLGRIIVDGASTVKIFGEEIDVSAEVVRLDGISGHADINGLLTWIQKFEISPQHVFVCHGEDGVCDSFAAKLRDELGLRAFAPYPYAKVDLLTDSILSEGNKVKIERKIQNGNGNGNGFRINSPYGRLVLAGKRLQQAILNNEGGSNKDLAKFADQIIALCEKWDR